MINTDNLVNDLSNIGTFTRSDLKHVMELKGYNATVSRVNHMMDRLISRGAVSRIGRNQYSTGSNKTYYSYPHTDTALSIVGEITEAHPYLDFRIFELIQLNEFVNHQIANNIIFISVESDLGDYVFNTLWEKHHGAMLIKPTIDDFYRYMTDGMVVINKLPSESPKGKPFAWDTRIEKLLVDIAVDKILNRVVPSGEYQAIYSGSIDKYIIDKNAMTRYARRRGALDKFRGFLHAEAKLSTGDFEL